MPTRYLPSRALGALLTLACALPWTGCSGGRNGGAVQTGPAVASFTAAQPVVIPGQGTLLTATFSNGSGTIDQGIGPVASGRPVPVILTGDTTYTLTVTGSAGEQATANLRVTIARPDSYAIADMVHARYWAASSPLPSGRVLVTGGYDGTDATNSAEWLDPYTNTFHASSPMNAARTGHTSTPLPDGTVLVAGGGSLAGCLASGELYGNPLPDGFALITATMAQARQYHTATLLPNGKVLLAGGRSTAGTALASGEEYDWTAFTFAAAGSMPRERYFHTATLLGNGKVLIAGGRDSASSTESACLYDPATRTFTATGSLQFPRHNHTATLLPDGKVLIAGGYDAVQAQYVPQAELYDPATGCFSPAASLLAPRSGHTAILLRNGNVLIAGGQADRPGGANATESLELYAGGVFLPAGSMTLPRARPVMELTPQGLVLLAGGSQDMATMQVNAKAELFDPMDPTPGRFTPAGTMASPRTGHAATLLGDGTVLVSGGTDGSGPVSRAERFLPAAGSFRLTGPMATPRSHHTATLLPDGRVLLTGGNAGLAPIASAELYDPATDTFAPAASMGAARADHTAILLPHSGNVLIVGGRGTSGYLATAELYHPDTNTFTPTANTLSTPRSQHTATLVPGLVVHHGGVLIAGGAAPDVLNTFELYDPLTGLFTHAGLPAMHAYRSGHAAIVLWDGRVLLTGGAGTSSETFDPVHPTSALDTSTGSLSACRDRCAAVPLPDGRILFAGGGEDTQLASAEYYDVGLGSYPIIGDFAPTGAMAERRGAPAGVRLPDGRVLVIGGEAGGLPSATAEYYR